MIPDHRFTIAPKAPRQDGIPLVAYLEANAYNDLVERAGTGGMPFLLILLCLPKDELTWLNVSGDNMVLQKCAYWCQLRGDLSDNAQTKRVRIPTANVFTPEAVTTILRDIKSGVMLP